MKPYYQDSMLTLYCGDCMDIMPKLPRVDAIVTDPPYGETSLQWDRWPTGWPALAATLSDQMWCFGSLRMFMGHASELADWKLAQDIVWEKHNGSNAAKDRFRRIHELSVHFYRGEWKGIHKEVQYTHNGTVKTIRRKGQPEHWGEICGSTYISIDGGQRMQNSIIKARSCHGYAVNETQRPEDIVAPLIQYSVPVGGVVLDCFAGSGTTLAVAQKLGCRAIGIEKRKSQCYHIVERLAQKDLLCA